MACCSGGKIPNSKKHPFIYGADDGNCEDAQNYLVRTTGFGVKYGETQWICGSSVDSFVLAGFLEPV